MKDILFDILLFLSNVFGYIALYYNNLKYKVFDGKVISVKIYNRRDGQLSEIYNYDNILYLLIMIFSNLFRIDVFTLWSIDDISYIVNNRNILIVCKYIKNKKEYNHIFSKDSYENKDINVKKKLVYSILHLPDGSDKNLCCYIRPYVHSILCNKDITWREILDITLKKDIPISYILTMADDDCQEKVWKSDDIATI